MASRACLPYPTVVVLLLAAGCRAPVPLPAEPPLEVTELALARENGHLVGYVGLGARRFRSELADGSIQRGEPVPALAAPVTSVVLARAPIQALRADSSDRSRPGSLVRRVRRDGRIAPAARATPLTRREARGAVIVRVVECPPSVGSWIVEWNLPPEEGTWGRHVAGDGAIRGEDLAACTTLVSFKAARALD